ncbi:MAG: DUF4129 domain-containing protein [Armatimonadetes bacterium]|nr:DUF4129 domain-containing protein [Armatimonadota bacterium]
MRTVALFCSVSLAASGWGAQSDAFEERIRSVRDETSFHRTVSEAPESWTEDGTLADELDKASETADWKSAQKRLVAASRLRRFEERGPDVGRVTDPSTTAKSILARPVFRDPGDRKSRNWFSDSVDRLVRVVRDFFEKLFKPDLLSGGASTGGAALRLLEPIVWGVLILGLLAFAVVFIAKFTLGKRARGAGGALLDEDEPDLNADEWLLRASELEARGELREAVRCLYLASLRRMDEAAILRFVRTETNWEHLRRYESGSVRPSGLDLRSMTREFDRVWYGHRVQGAEDVAMFRSYYKVVLQAMGRAS